MYRMSCLVLGCCVALAACETTTTVTPIEREWQAELEGQVEWEHLNGASVVQFTEGTTSFVAAAAIAVAQAAPMARGTASEA